jgi:hypothetical protein
MQKPSTLVLAAGSLGDALLTLPSLRLLSSRSSVTIAGTDPYLALGGDLLGVQTVSALEPLLQALLKEDPLDAKTRDFLSGFKDIHLFFKEIDPKLLERLSLGAQVHAPRRPFTEFLSEGRWAAEYWLETASAEELPSDSPFRQAQLGIGDELKEKGRKILSSLGLDAPLIIHPGSGSPAKNAPLSFFREAAEKITGETDKGILVLWGEAERERTAEIQGAFQGLPRTVVLGEPLPLRDVAALLSLSCGYLGNDSGITHLASACGTRTFALFNSTDAKVWGPQANFIILSMLKGNLH